MSSKLIFLCWILGLSSLQAQRPPGPPPARQHTATEAKILKLVRASRRPPGKNEVTIEKGKERIEIEANGIPDHKVGPFPNRGNPHEISEQGYDIELPSNPEEAEQITLLHAPPGQVPPRPLPFGITLDGVIIQPDTAEFWMGDRNKNWNYEALGGAVGLGLDSNYAHVQPTGMYHYHGIPTGLMHRLGFKKGQHSPMIGWAADGFPIYALFGYSDPNDPGSEIVELKTGYALKQGERPEKPDGPSGDYDGAFVQDYEYVNGAGNLDECNGRFCVTPDFPQGTYAYFMTSDWPVIPRAFRGTPIELVQPRRGPGRGGPPGKGPARFGKGGKGPKGPPPPR